MGVDWSETVRLMEVTACFFKCTYCVFTLYGRIKSNTHGARISQLLFHLLYYYNYDLNWKIGSSSSILFQNGRPLQNGTLLVIINIKMLFFSCKWCVRLLEESNDRNLFDFPWHEHFPCFILLCFVFVFYRYQLLQITFKKSLYKTVHACNTYDVILASVQ